MGSSPFSNVRVNTKFAEEKREGEGDVGGEECPSPLAKKEKEERNKKGKVTAHLVPPGFLPEGKKRKKEGEEGDVPCPLRVTG